MQAEGIASGEAINKCPPGGNETIAALAELLEVPVIELDLSRGTAPPQIAYIREIRLWQPFDLMSSIDCLPSFSHWHASRWRMRACTCR